MTKINPSQIFSIAVLMRLFTLISSTEKLSSDNICGVFISIAFQAVLLFPLLKVYHINPDFINRKTSKIYLVIVSLFLILISAENMCNFWNTSNSINFPIGSKYIALALLSVVCIYGCAVGLKAMGRSAFLLLILSIFALLLLIIGSISKINPNYFTPVSTGNNILRAAIIDFSQSVELVPLIILLSYSTKRFS
ncbi:MAG: hypothetical protein LBM93_13310, partial [Oscillospiraceae bacterium]|nr:hypothetical protein [Oscillospiraceae bacterium]